MGFTVSLTGPSEWRVGFGLWG